MGQICPQCGSQCSHKNARKGFSGTHTTSVWECSECGWDNMPT